MKKELTCIRCPLGCEISIEIQNSEIVSISGNTCKRGEDYAKSECLSPVRTVTTTMVTKNGVPVPVKTDNPIPKERIFDCMKIINGTKISTPIKIGDILIKDVFGANIVATADFL